MLDEELELNLRLMEIMSKHLSHDPMLPECRVKKICDQAFLLREEMKKRGMIPNKNHCYLREGGNQVVYLQGRKEEFILPPCQSIMGSDPTREGSSLIEDLLYLIKQHPLISSFIATIIIGMIIIFFKF